MKITDSIGINKLGLLLLAFCCAIVSCDKLPDSDIVTDIPNTYKEYLDRRVEVINKAIDECGGEYDCFFWITDIHWEQDLNTRHAPAMIKYLASKTGINKILNGGDTGNADVICQNAIDRLRDAIGSDKVYTVTGNHEITDASKYEKPFQRVNNTLRGHARNLVYGDDDKSYFYFDDDISKTRYVGLSVFGLYRNGWCESALNDAQLSWFKNIALNVSDGWSIIVFAHSLYFVNDVTNQLCTSPSGANDFINEIDSYCGKGKITCVLMGHTHRDRMHKGKTGVPYIISACDRYSAYYSGSIPDINVDRVPGTISEQHFEVVLIDKKHRKVRLFSIGAQARDGYDNVSGNLVDERVIAY